MRLFVVRTAIVSIMACSVMLGVILWQTGPVSTASAQDSAPRVINVNGQGQILQSPDMATVYLGVETSGRTAQAAMEQNGKLMNAILEYIKSLGILESDIQTTGINLYPTYNRVPVLQDEPSNGGGDSPPTNPPVPPPAPPTATPAPVSPVYPLPAVLSYRAVNQVRVSVYDFGKLVWVIDGSVSQGATMVSGVNFGLQDSKRAEQEALRAAVADARSRADVFAGSLGVTIVGVQTASESSYYGGGPYPMPVGVPGKGGDATPVQPGELSVSANVSVAYLIQ